MYKTLSCLVLATSLACSAQQVAAQPAGAGSDRSLPADAASVEQVRKLIRLLNLHRAMEQYFVGMKAQMQSGAEQGFRSQVPDATPKQLAAVRSMFDDVFSEFSVDDMVEAIVPIYQRHLTNADVEGIIAFYTSAVGQKLLREQPAMMQEGIQAGGKIAQQKMDGILKKLDVRINEMAKEAQKEHAPN